MHACTCTQVCTQITYRHTHPHIHIHVYLNRWRSLQIGNFTPSFPIGTLSIPLSCWFALVKASGAWLRWVPWFAPDLPGRAFPFPPCVAWNCDNWNFILLAACLLFLIWYLPFCFKMFHVRQAWGAINTVLLSLLFLCVQRCRVYSQKWFSQ